MGVGPPGLRGRSVYSRYTVTTRMTSALRRAAMRAILMFQKEVMDKVTVRQCPQTTTFSKRKESRSARPNRLTASTAYARAVNSLYPSRRKQFSHSQPCRNLSSATAATSVVSNSVYFRVFSCVHWLPLLRLSA